MKTAELHVHVQDMISASRERGLNDHDHDWVWSEQASSWDQDIPGYVCACGAKILLGKLAARRCRPEKTRAGAPRYTGSAPAHEAGPSHEGPVVTSPATSPGS